MPEGDTIYRAALTLNRALSGRLVTKFETQLAHLARVDDDRPVVGRTIERVESNGKWMRISFSGDLILLTHMLMSGSWHIYRPGEQWQRSRARMRVAIHTDAFIAVGFDVPVAEFHTSATLARHRSVRQLGPDILAADFDERDAVARIASHPKLEIGEALLRQHVIAGLGNVFKSEVCFASRVNPFRSVQDLSANEIALLVSSAAKFMKTSTQVRRTTGRSNPEESLWVYGRRGQPCRRCGSPIESRKQGDDARSTFWCPQCQPA